MSSFSCNDCGSTGSARFLTTHDCQHNQQIRAQGGRCEDFPCCGHTDGDGCITLESHTADFWRNDPHLLCDHEAGFCDADYDDYDEEDED